MRKFLSLLISFSLLLSLCTALAACNGKDPDTEQQENNGESEVPNGPDTNIADTPTDSESGSDAETISDPAIEFITYNIAFYEATKTYMTVYYEGQTLEDYTIAKRALRLNSFVEHYMPDVLALQEVNWRWWPYIIKNEDSIINTFGYEWEGNQGALRTQDGKGTSDLSLYNLLLWNPEKFEKIDGGVIRINNRERLYGDGNKDRMCTWAILKNKTTGVETLFASTHLCTRGDDSLKDLNLSQAKVLTEKLIALAEGRTIIVGGDFNASQSSSTYKHITTQAGFSDAHETAKINRAPLMASTRFWGENTKWKNGNPIDHIFYFGDTYTAEKYAVLYDTFDENNVISQDMSKVGKYYDLSDHLGVFTRFIEKGQ